MAEAELKAGDYRVIFLPDKGMNFISLKRGEIEAIDQSTKDLFETRYAGLGALIGPHFHHRAEALIPNFARENFPFLAHVTSKEPFSHGIGRYAPWTVEKLSDTQLKALLKGDDEWKGVSLRQLEGQDFTMRYEAELTPKGLNIDLSVMSETDSVIGLHTYYAAQKGRVRAKAQEGDVDYEVGEPIDASFHPSPNPLRGEMTLETSSHTVKVEYSSDNEENSFQIWHPEGASFVCMEPLSASNPRKPKLSVSRLKVFISIEGGTR